MRQSSKNWNINLNNLGDFNRGKSKHRPHVIKIIYRWEISVDTNW